MKKRIILLSTVLLFAALAVSSCTKDNATEQAANTASGNNSLTSERSEVSTFCTELPNCNENWYVQVVEVFPANSEYYVQIDAVEAPPCADDICDDGLTNQCCVEAFRSSGFNSNIQTNGCYGNQTPVVNVGETTDLPWYYTRKYAIELQMRDQAGNIIYYNEANPNTAYVKLRFFGKGFLGGACPGGPPQPAEVTVYPSQTPNPLDTPCAPLATISCCRGLFFEACE